MEWPLSFCAANCAKRFGLSDWGAFESYTYSTVVSENALKLTRNRGVVGRIGFFNKTATHGQRSKEQEEQAISGPD